MEESCGASMHKYVCQALQDVMELCSTRQKSKNRGDGSLSPTEKAVIDSEAQFTSNDIT